MKTLLVNGEQKNLSAETVAELLEQLDYLSDKVAVAINGEFVPRSQYSTQTLQVSDSLEVLSAVQGG